MGVRRWRVDQIWYIAFITISIIETLLYNSKNYKLDNFTISDAQCGGNGTIIYTCHMPHDHLCSLKQSCNWSWNMSFDWSWNMSCFIWVFTDTKKSFTLKEWRRRSLWFLALLLIVKMKIKYCIYISNHLTNFLSNLLVLVPRPL